MILVLGVRPCVGCGFPTSGAARSCQSRGMLLCKCLWHIVGPQKTPIQYWWSAVTWSCESFAAPSLSYQLVENPMYALENGLNAGSCDSDRSKSLSWHGNVVLANSILFALSSYCIWFSLQPVAKWQRRGFNPPSQFHGAAWSCQYCRALLICSTARGLGWGWAEASAGSPCLKIAVVQHSLPVCWERFHLCKLSLQAGDSVGFSQSKMSPVNNFTFHRARGMTVQPGRDSTYIGSFSWAGEK